MNKKDNRRVSMTKKIIQEVFLELLEKKDINKISIRELCEKADINRSTFYKYYDSQYDLLEKMEKDLLNEVEQECEKNNQGTLSILNFIKKHKKMCKLLLTANANPNFLKELFHLPIIEKLLNEYIEDKNNSQYIKTFILYGGYYLVLNWINNDCKEKPEVIVELLMSFIK